MKMRVFQQLKRNPSCQMNYMKDLVNSLSLHVRAHVAHYQLKQADWRKKCVLHLVVIPQHIHGTLGSVGCFKRTGENRYVKQMHVPEAGTVEGLKY